MKKRIIRLGVILVILAAIAAVVRSYLQEPPPPQVITLPNGQQYRLTGVTYGTQHVQGPTLARLANHLPAFLANFLRRKLGVGTAYSFQTPQPALGVWLEPVVSTNAGPGRPSPVYYSSGNSSLQAMLADENGVLAGKVGESSLPLGSLRSVSIPSPLFFPLVPTRSRTLNCCLFTVPPGSEGPYKEVARVHFPNPVFSRASAWNAGPVPATQRTGDLEVRLEHFTAGKPAPGTRFNFLTGNPSPGTRLTKFQPAKTGEEAWTAFDFTLSSPPGADATWALHSADLSDPGGNHLRASWSTHDQWPWQFMKGTLWPDEAAWRLKLEFKRKSGFAPAELVTFTNMPLLTFGVAGPILRTNIVKGLQLVLTESAATGTPYASAPTITPMFRIEAPNVEGTAFDFVRLVTDQGETMVMREMLDTSRTTRTVVTSPAKIMAAPSPLMASAPRLILFGKEPPTNAATVNLTWAMQKTRSVEFLVQPPPP